MCGIAGYIKDNNYEVTREDIEWTFRKLEPRGMDATGIAWLDKDTHVFNVMKAPVTASEFIELPAFDEHIGDIVASNIVLFHVRLATHGAATLNMNNHPIHNRGGMIIHNGVVFLREKFQTVGQTDTEQMMLSIQRHGLIKGLARTSGSASIAYVDFSTGNMYLYSRYTPMVYAEKEMITAFASTRDVLKEGLWIEQGIKSIEKSTVFKMNEKDRRLVNCGKAIERRSYPTTRVYRYGDYGVFPC